MPSSQLIGQAPGASGGMPTSHDSPISTTPLPHAFGQSSSTMLVAPGGQQPSLSLPDGMTIGKRTHTAEQVPADISVPIAQAVPDVQSDALGQAPAMPRVIAVSQVSPGSTTPFLHVGAQSVSSGYENP